MDLHRRAARARRLRGYAIPDWDEFVRDWFAYNAIYARQDVRIEREQVMRAVSDHVTRADATRVLNGLSDEIAFLTALPPGNLRASQASQQFRARSVQDLSVVNTVTNDPLTRLAHLMSVVYQVRCNLFHGGKDPDGHRDRDLVRVSRRILSSVLDVIIP